MTFMLFYHNSLGIIFYGRLKCLSVFITIPLLKQQMFKDLKDILGSSLIVNNLDFWYDYECDNQNQYQNRMNSKAKFH